MIKLAKILIVDDKPLNIKLLGELLHQQHDIIVATNGEQALQLAGEEQVDLILMDVVMPEMNGFTVCRLLKQQPETAEIPVIFITASTDRDDIIKGFEAGGQDYISKPFNTSELYARVQNHLELGKSRQSLREYAQEMDTMNQELKHLLQQLEVLAHNDPLTGASNRRDAMDKINMEIARYKRTRHNFSLALIDIDDFKVVNDNYGHEGGDFLLQKLVKLMQANLRQQDLLARWGGDEFLIMLPNTEASEARQAVEKIQRLVEASKFFYNGMKISVTLTAGVTQFDPTLEMNQNLDRADQALYAGKRKNKNCVVLA